MHRDGHEVVVTYIEEIGRVLKQAEVELFEIGRSQDPMSRLKDNKQGRNYTHMMYLAFELAPELARDVESRLNTAFGGDPRYRVGGAKDGRGPGPLKGGQWVYLVWNGKCHPMCHERSEHLKQEKESGWFSRLFGG